jgi:serine/threonine protein kinase
LCFAFNQQTTKQGVADIDFEAEVELDALLGTGAFGAVYRGRWRRAGGRAVAVKMLHNVGGADELASFTSEVAVLSRLCHPCIVQFLGACLAPPHACMLEELVEGGSLHGFMHGCGTRSLSSY